jgi:hypothetical protein
VTEGTTDLSAGERKLVDAYQLVVDALANHRDELQPFEERNAIKALAALWQVANGLDLAPGQVYELGA